MKELLSAIPNNTPSMPLLYKPFLCMAEATIEPLEPLPTGDEGPDYQGPSDVIKEREGIHYVNDNVLSPDHEESISLNKDFKDLVDSIIKQSSPKEKN